MATKKKVQKKISKIKPAKKVSGSSAKSRIKPKTTAKKSNSKPPVAKKKVATKKVAAKKIATKKATVPLKKKVASSKAALSKQPKGKASSRALSKTSKNFSNKSNKAAIQAKPQKAEPQTKTTLDPVFAKIRQGLITSRAELYKMVTSSQELERNVSELTFSNEIDLASSLEGREMVFQLASRDRNGLKLIDDALFKMAHGTYGICESCTKPIGIKRLQILPLTQFCIECQEKMEHAS